MDGLVLEKQNVPVTQIDWMIKALAEYVQRSEWEFEQVVGIERGGLFVSRPLAAMLGLPHDSVYISCYTETGRRETPIISGSYNTDLSTLIVDDLIDGGSTIRLFKERFVYKPNDAVGVLFWNEKSSQEPDFYVCEKPEQWLVFPWELEREN